MSFRVKTQGLGEGMEKVSDWVKVLLQYQMLPGHSKQRTFAVCSSLLLQRSCVIPKPTSRITKDW